MSCPLRRCPPSLRVRAARSGSAPAQPSLPPVEAPTGTFILQLFLIPLLIVSIVVVLWLMFSWVAHMGRDDPADAGASRSSGATRRAGSGRMSWPICSAAPIRSTTRCAATPTLAERAGRVSRARPERAGPRASRGDAAARDAADVPLPGARLFHVPDGLPVLLRAASEERDPVEVEVRYSASRRSRRWPTTAGRRRSQNDERRAGRAAWPHRAAGRHAAPRRRRRRATARRRSIGRTPSCGRWRRMPWA